MQISGTGIVTEISPRGFRIHVEQLFLNIEENIWLYYSMWPAWYRNYPPVSPLVGDRVAITAVYNEKSNAWHLKEYAIQSPMLHPEPTEIQEDTVPEENTPSKSEISGNFVDAQEHVNDENSQRMNPPVPVEYVALELACQVAPQLLGQEINNGTTIGTEIVKMAEKFKKFLVV